MAWYDPRDWDDYIRGKLDKPMRAGDEEFRDPNQAAYQLPGFEQRDASLGGFADSRGGGEFRQGQSDLASYLGAQMRGQNSLAAEQLRQQTGRLQSMQQSMAASASPANRANAARLAMQNAGDLGARMAGQQQMAQIAERNAAAQGLGGVLGQGRGQDLQAYLGAQQLALQNAQAQQQGGLAMEQARTQRYLASLGIPSGREGIISALGAGLSLAGGTGG